MNEEIKLELKGICKTFPGVKALNKVDIKLRKGTVHAVMGENGAGKSTLMKIINGLYHKDSGHIFLDGHEVTFSSPQESAEAGIAMIYQELNFFPELTVAENIFMGRHPNKVGFVNWKKLSTNVRNIFEQNDLEYDPEIKIKELSVSKIQMLEIVKAVAFNASVIIMDEPTSSISNKEVEMLFETIENLKAKGISIIYISHKMEEIFKIADDITVIRDGETIISGPVSNFDNDSLITHMVGRPLTNIYPKKNLEIGENIFEVKNLCSEGFFKDISFHLRRREMIGFAGLVGAGRTEVARALFGLDSYDSGEILRNGVPIRNRNTSDAISNKLIMMSEDRKKEGVIGARSIRENMSISTHRVRKGGFVNLRREYEEASEMKKQLSIKCPDIETTLNSLSGGNQQKVILARWLMVGGEIMIMDEPTRGIDIGAKFDIYNIMTKLLKQGISIIMISSELPELIGMCDRIYVMNKGHITGCLGKESFNQEEIMRYATQAV